MPPYPIANTVTIHPMVEKFPKDYVPVYYTDMNIGFPTTGHFGSFGTGYAGYPEGALPPYPGGK